jgi:hypothetical protein
VKNSAPPLYATAGQNDYFVRNSQVFKKQLTKLKNRVTIKTQQEAIP